MRNLSIFFLSLIITIGSYNQVLAQITITGTTTWVDPGDTYDYTVGGASSCPNDYIISSTKGTNTANNSGAGTGSGPFTYKWNNESGGDFTMSAANTGASCSSTLPKVVSISHIYLSGLGNISTPGGSVPCSTSPITITVGAPTTSPSFNVTNTSQNVQLIYTWNIPQWGVSNVQTTTNQITVSPNAGSAGNVSVSVKRNDAKVATTKSTSIARSGQVEFYSISPSSLRVCDATSTIALTVSAANTTNYEWFVPGLIGGNGITLNGTATAGDFMSTSSATVYLQATSAGKLDLQISNGCSYFDVPRYEVTFGKPNISYPIQTLFDAGSHMWQLSYDNPGSTSCTYTVISGSASLNPVNKDCYVTSTAGAVVQLVATNSCGNTAHNFYIPAASGSFMAIYPNPATNEIAVQFNNTDNPPSTLSLVSESSSKEVQTVNVEKAIANKQIGDDGKITLDVKNLPRGIYYLNTIPNSSSKEKPSTMRIKLE